MEPFKHLGLHCIVMYPMPYSTILYEYYRNVKRSEIDQVELAYLQPNGQGMEEEARRDDEDDQLVESNEEDRTRLLGNEEEEEDTQKETLQTSPDLTVKAIVFSNPKDTSTGASNGAGTASASEVSRIKVCGQPSEEVKSLEVCHGTEQKQLSSLWKAAKKWARHFVKDMVFFLG